MIQKSIKIVMVFILLITILCGCTPKKYIISLIHNENVTKIEIEAGETFYYEGIEEEGYLFYGWFNENNIEANGQIINENKTFIGKYIKIGTKFKIEYVLNGGELKRYAPFEYEIGQVTNIPNASAVGNMKFLGWYYNEELIEELDETFYGDIVLVAKWDDKNIYHTIAYNLNGGNIDGDILYQFIEGLEDYSLPIPKKDGYVFKGWYLEEEYINRIKYITKQTNKDLQLYAKFELFDKNNLNVSFLGDSITTYINTLPEDYPSYYPTQGCDVDTIEETWWYQVVEKTNLNLMQNNSYSGSKVTGGDGCGNSIERISNLSKGNDSPDVIIIHMGTNDLTHRIPKDVFEKGYIKMIELIKKECDDAIIFVLNLPGMKHQGFEKERSQYNEIIQSICEQYNLNLVDIAKVITNENYSDYMFAGAHPNVIGMKIISEEVINKINEVIK